MNNVQQNHERVQENRRNVAVSRIEIFLFRFGILLNLAFVIADIVILATDWNATCNVPIKYYILSTLLYTIFATVMTIYKKIKGITSANIGDHPHVRRLSSFINFVALGVYIWGWIWFSQADPCAATPTKNLMFAHLLITTILMGLMLLFLILLCICVPILVMLNDYLPPEDGVEQNILDQMFEYNYVQDNGIAQPILDRNPGANVEDVNIPDDEDRACCICLERYMDNAKLRVLPCKHHFHKECCDEWLRRNNSCPLCRQKAVNEDIV